MEQGKIEQLPPPEMLFLPFTETSIEGPGVLLNITGGNGLGLFEVNEAAEIIAEAVDPEANIILERLLMKVLMIN